MQWWDPKHQIQHGYLFYISSHSVCFVFFETVSLYSSACPGTHSIDQIGLKLTEICVHLPPERWDKRMRHHRPALLTVLITCLFCCLLIQCMSFTIMHKVNSLSPMWRVPEVSSKALPEGKPLPRCLLAPNSFHGSIREFSKSCVVCVIHRRSNAELDRSILLHSIKQSLGNLQKHWESHFTIDLRQWLFLFAFMLTYNEFIVNVNKMIA